MSRPRKTKARMLLTRSYLGHTLFLKMQAGEVAFHILTVIDPGEPDGEVTVATDEGRESMILMADLEAGIAEGLLTIVRTPREERLALLDRMASGKTIEQLARSGDPAFAVN